jgi:hypothetical protein
MAQRFHLNDLNGTLGDLRSPDAQKLGIPWNVAKPVSPTPIPAPIIIITNRVPVGRFVGFDQFGYPVYHFY